MIPINTSLAFIGPGGTLARAQPNYTSVLVFLLLFLVFSIFSWSLIELVRCITGLAISYNDSAYKQFYLSKLLRRGLVLFLTLVLFVVLVICYAIIPEFLSVVLFPLVLIVPIIVLLSLISIMWILIELLIRLKHRIYGCNDEEKSRNSKRITKAILLFSLSSVYVIYIIFFILFTRSFTN